MANNSRTTFRQELDLIERFVASYQKQLGGVIDQLNAHHDPAVETRSLRLCVEAVNMMLATHGQLASALKRLAGPVHADSDARPRPETESRPRVTRRAA